MNTQTSESVRIFCYLNNPCTTRGHNACIIITPLILIANQRGCVLYSDVNEKKANQDCTTQRTTKSVHCLFIISFINRESKNNELVFFSCFEILFYTPHITQLLRKSGASS